MARCHWTFSWGDSLLRPRGRPRREPSAARSLDCGGSDDRWSTLLASISPSSSARAMADRCCFWRAHCYQLCRAIYSGPGVSSADCFLDSTEHLSSREFIHTGARCAGSFAGVTPHCQCCPTGRGVEIIRPARLRCITIRLRATTTNGAEIDCANPQFAVEHFRMPRVRSVYILNLPLSTLGSSALVPRRSLGISVGARVLGLCYKYRS